MFPKRGSAVDQKQTENSQGETRSYPISSKVLSDSLSNVEDVGLVDRDIVSEKPFRVAYSLTERGEDLRPIIEEMRTWGQKYLVPAEDTPST